MLTEKSTGARHVLVVDDDLIVRTAVTAAFRSADYHVSEAHDGENAVELAASLRPDVITMDILMPPGMSGIDATRRIIESRPEVRVVMFSVYEAEGVVAAAVAAGATSYITKAAGLPILVDAVGRALRGQKVLIPAPNQTFPALTNRDRQVLELAVKGFRSREIADQLHLSPRTVENHLARIYTKLGVRGRWELANKVTGGEITPDGVNTTRVSDLAAPHAEESIPTQQLEAALPQLSTAERRVVALVAQGMTNRNVAERLFLSRHTVDAHLRNIFTKLGVKRRIELAGLLAKDADE